MFILSKPTGKKVMEEVSVLTYFNLIRASSRKVGTLNKFLRKCLKNKLALKESHFFVIYSSCEVACTRKLGRAPLHVKIRCLELWNTFMGTCHTRKLALPWNSKHSRSYFFTIEQPFAMGHRCLWK